MAREYTYYGTTKKILVAFASIFDEIEIETEGRMVRVPLAFSQKEKFVDSLVGGTDDDMDALNFDAVFPRIGFEISGFNFAPERHTNPMHQWTEENEIGDEFVMYNRIPYDINFSLFIGAKKLEDSLKIVEQIWPYFSPELTLTINDKEDFLTETNVPIILTSSSMNVEYEGSLDQRRVIFWQLDFTAKAFYYPIVREGRRIKQTIMNFRESDFDTLFLKYTSTVNPIDAKKSDPHTIVDVEENRDD